VKFLQNAGGDQLWSSNKASGDAGGYTPLKIEQVKIDWLELPYKKPLITATNKFITARGLLVTVIADEGAEGYGYADIFDRTGESLESARYAIERIIKPNILGGDLRELMRLRQRMDRLITGNSRAKAALETALYDTLAKSLHVPLYLLVGGRYRDEITIVRMVGLDDSEGMVEEARRLVRDGFKGLKLKLSGKKDLDISRVSDVRNAVGDKVFIKVDANEAYDAKTAIVVSKRFADLGVAIFEQPVPRSQIEALQEVKKHSPIKIEADQSVRTLEEAHRLIQNRVVDALNTSIQKVGGIHDVRRIAELCDLAGVGCAFSNTAGSMVGDAAALHLAASIPSMSSFCELGEFETVSGDPFAGLKVTNGALRLPEAEGLGVELKETLAVHQRRDESA
jgi:L-alanine-DL-glutamate epimerase-like enolase superfamily enzyme